MERRIVRTGQFDISAEEKKIISEVLDTGRITEHIHTQNFEKN
jgi:hypothetical protein